MAILRAACVQMTAHHEPAETLAHVIPLIRDAAAQGASLVITPENTGLLDHRRDQVLAKAEPVEGGLVIGTLRDLARDLGIWLHVGSTPTRLGPDVLANRAWTIAPDGTVVATYDKVHMFDVDLPNGERYRESSSYRAGSEAVLVDLPGTRLGISICYDLRFAYLYRALAQAGAQVLTIPAAFTRPTGEAHWHILQRARAIETGCWVLSPAQCGTHSLGRKTYGHSLIVAPWGEVVADAGADDPGVIVADLDMAAVADARARVPALTHDRMITVRAPRAHAAE